MSTEKLLDGENIGDQFSNQLEAAVNKKEGCCPCLAASVFPCLGNPAEEIVKEANLTPDILGPDGGEQQFSLINFLQPMQPSDEAKVELEDVRNNPETGEAYPPETLAANVASAKEHLTEIVGMVMRTGVMLWILVNCAGLAALTSDCKVGPPAWSTIFLVAAIIIQVHQLHWVTLKMSLLKIEDRAMLSMIRGFSGLDAYRLMCIFAVLDMLGRFSRAQFVGFAIVCDDAYNDELYESFDKSPLAFLTPFLRTVGGLGGLAALSWLAGPMLISQGYMVYCWRTVKFHLKKASEEDDAEDDNDWHVTSMMDELGSLAQWAMLDPAGKVLQKAALPQLVEDADDAIRTWQALTSKSYAMAAKLIPDNVIQMQLQARFLALAFNGMDNSSRIQIVGSFVLTAGDALFSSLDIILLNMRLPVLLGGAVFLLSLEPIIRVIAAFLCPSHVWNMSAFSCAIVHATNHSAGGMIPTFI